MNLQMFSPSLSFLFVLLDATAAGDVVRPLDLSAVEARL